MDIRGIEVTNQLRSAIRAKLLELGVRYDEELPDYILVMVVNKKSRQQMHQDLHLFLENCTTPFVDWLHDQVLKKLQKVTVAKKKSLREFVPTVVVKQEEERKKKKVSTTSFLEDQTSEQPKDKGTCKNVKDDKLVHKQNTKSAISSQKSDVNQSKNAEKCMKPMSRDIKMEGTPPIQALQQDVAPKKAQIDDQNGNVAKEAPLSDSSGAKSIEFDLAVKANDLSSKSLKRPLDVSGNYPENLRQNDAKKSKLIELEEDVAVDGTRKLKSCVNKPKITSVVSVKNRLGIVSPRKKFEIYREKMANENRYRQSEKRFEKYRLDTAARSNSFQRGRNFEAEDRFRKNRESETKHSEPEKANDIKNRLGNAKNERTAKASELREKGGNNVNAKAKQSEKLTGTVKDRLGISNASKPQKQSAAKSQEVGGEFRNAKCLEQDRDSLGSNKNIKNRLGPLKSNFRPAKTKALFNAAGRRSQSSEDEDCFNLGTAEEVEENGKSVGNAGPIKSHIIAVNKITSTNAERKRLKPLDKSSKEVLSDAEDEPEDMKIPSKVIVTPRPLKPLQPTQKRATQSLLLRAVAEANQSVVTQKNPEPCLMEKKPALKRVKPAVPRDVGQNLSVYFNASKRLVMEKIQVELNTVDTTEDESKPYIPQPVNDEHMGVVMSLFQRSDDNQKFLVTLNGYNNNLIKKKATSDDEERLEVEVNEEDELALLTTQNESYGEKDTVQTVFRITDTEDDTETNRKERPEENNENCNTENVEKTEEVPRKRRKLSPIVYNRSHSPSPIDLKASTPVSTPVSAKRLEKKPLSENVLTVVDKSRERCRYWPNCNLGRKCAYYHPYPPVMCSAFPACKYGDKCAYKHPKCKFGLSCTKLGCVFYHSAQQCKYHPFCTKAACPYSHPAPHSTMPLEATTQRAKFTWRRRD